MRVPEHFTDGEELSKTVWDFWVTIMKTDRVLNSDQFPKWDELDKEWKQRFLEAVTSQIVGPLSLALMKPENATIPCYTCGDVVVSYPGQLCTRCYYTHIHKRGDSK